MGSTAVVFDDDNISDDEPGETIRLRPYLDWPDDNESKQFPRTSSQVPLSPKQFEEDSISENEVERGNWTGKFDFILSLIGYSVGLGNVWRFPYLCYDNGGGAFLIPFIAMMLLAGLPLMFMELSFGQYASLGPIAIFERFCPLFKGCGYGMVIVSSIVMLYYNMIIAWTLFYMFASLRIKVPWSTCDPEWRTASCYSYQEADDCNYKNGTYYNGMCYSAQEATSLNQSALSQHKQRKTPADEYFINHVLGRSSGIEETGGIQIHLALSLLTAWLIVYLCLSKGVQSSGKVVYFTALFPYLVLVILFFLGISLPGASDGILFYITPKFRLLFKAKVWGDAAVQVFFALSPSWGGLITLASYNKFHNNCYKDALIVTVSNVLTSIFAGFVIFSILGYLAHELDKPVEDVVDQGAGLAFMVYPEIVARLPGSPLWAFLFFFMLLTLGLDSQFALLETVQTAILDRFPHLRERKALVLLCVIGFGYSGGLIFTTRGGVYWLELLDKFAANFSVLIIALIECVLISWYYGAEAFLRDIEKMIGSQSYRWTAFWSFMWKYATPSTLLFIIVFTCATFEPLKSGESWYPTWANVFGWCVTLLPVFVILLMMVHTYFTSDIKAPCFEKMKRLMQPTESWGPSHKELNLKSSLPAIQEDNGNLDRISRQNSFDNPSFNVTYTFETNI